MNKNAKRKLCLILGGLLLLLSIPFIYRESQKKVELYVNPAFKISDYKYFYFEYAPGSVKDHMTGLTDILIAGELSPVDSLDEITPTTRPKLYITLKIKDGFVFPPYIGHFNPRNFITKTVAIEMYNNKFKEQLLFRLYTWRGTFNDGYDYFEYMDFLIKELSQAGWKEKNLGIIHKR